MNKDIVIIGAGPAGIFTALELLRRGSRQSILLVDKGQPVEKRRSANKAPFSAIRLCPAKTMSVEDSPSPASA